MFLMHLFTIAQHTKFIFPDNAIREPHKSPFQGSAGKFREIQGFLLQTIGMKKKGRSRES